MNRCICKYNVLRKVKDACLSIQEIIRKGKNTDFKVITIFSLINCLVYTAMYISPAAVMIY